MVTTSNVDQEICTGAHNACPFQIADVIYAVERLELIKEMESAMPTDAWFRQSFDEENLNRVRAAFLYKPYRRAYEEEVDIVKRPNDETEDSIRVKTECFVGRELYLYKLRNRTISRFSNLSPRTIKKASTPLCWQSSKRCSTLRGENVRRNTETSRLRQHS